MTKYALLFDPDTGSPLTATLDLEPISVAGGLDYLAQAVFPIDPVPLASLPSIAIGGVEAQVEPVSYMANGDVDVIQAIAPVASGTTTADVTSGPGFQPPATVPGLDLSSVVLRLKAANVGTELVASLASPGTVRIERDGRYLREERYWNRFLLESGSGDPNMPNPGNTGWQADPNFQGPLAAWPFGSTIDDAHVQNNTTQGADGIPEYVGYDCPTIVVETLLPFRFRACKWDGGSYLDTKYDWALWGPGTGLKDMEVEYCTFIGPTSGKTHILGPGAIKRLYRSLFDVAERDHIGVSHKSIAGFWQMEIRENYFGLLGYQAVSGHFDYIQAYPIGYGGLNVINNTFHTTGPSSWSDGTANPQWDPDSHCDKCLQMPKDTVDNGPMVWDGNWILGGGNTVLNFGANATYQGSPPVTLINNKLGGRFKWNHTVNTPSGTVGSGNVWWGGPLDQYGLPTQELGEEIQVTDINGATVSVNANDTLLQGPLQAVGSVLNYGGRLCFTEQEFGGGSPLPSTEHFGVHTWITRRSDVEVYEVDVLVSNGVCDPTQNPFVTHAAADGELYFDYLQLDLSGLPGWIAVPLVTRSSMDWSDPARPYLVAPLSASEQHLLPARSWFCRRIAICKAVDATAARHILEYRGNARVHGPSSYYSKEGWGPRRELLPTLTADYRVKVQGVPGQTGLAGAEEIADDFWTATKAAMEAGTSAQFPYELHTTALGWAHPLGALGRGYTGGVLVHPCSGWNYSRRFWRIRRLQMEADMERCPIAIVDVGTGEPVGPKAWVDNNGPQHTGPNGVQGETGKQPWDIRYSSDVDDEVPVLLHVDAIEATKTAKRQNRGLLPTDRLWNATDVGKTCPYHDQIRWHDETLLGVAYTPQDSAHFIRHLRFAQDMVWGVNSRLARFVIRMMGAFSEYAMPRYRIGGHIAFVDNSIPVKMDQAVADPGQGWAGMGRDKAWTVEPVSMRYGLEEDAAARAELLAYFQDLADLIDKDATPSGCMLRFHSKYAAPGDKSITWNGSPNPFKNADFGPTDWANSTGGAPDGVNEGTGLADGSTPYDISPTFWLAYFNWAAWGIQRRAFEGTEPGRVTKMKKVTLNGPRWIFANLKDLSAQNLSPWYVNLVGPTDGAAELPYKPWDFQAQGGPKIFQGGNALTLAAQGWMNSGLNWYLDRALQELGLFGVGTYADIPAAVFGQKDWDSFLDDEDRLRDGMYLAALVQNMV